MPPELVVVAIDKLILQHLPQAADRSNARKLITLHYRKATGWKTMTQITTHLLDTTRGMPAENVLTTLMHQQGDDWLMLGSGITDAQGRVSDFLAGEQALASGIYKLTFYLADYYASLGQRAFFPQVDVVFDIEGDGQHYHLPLLLNPYGYTTYRGS